jgi:hypothetical protein
MTYHKDPFNLGTSAAWVSTLPLARGEAFFGRPGGQHPDWELEPERHPQLQLGYPFDVGTGKDLGDTGD